MLLTLVITILIQWGIIKTPAEFYQLPPAQQEQYIKKIIEDDIGAV